MSNAIEINKLTKYYGKHRGIEDVSFSVREGEVFGFIGPNGAGKSTTIRVLLALLYPTAGSASIFGRDCIKDAPENLKRIGYLPSEVFYYDGMRVIDLLNYSASFYRKDCTARIKQLAARMDLDLKRRIDDLSYGNKKKVGIVQGLLHEPDLIILDEPTSGLDPLMQQTFFDLIKEENARGATILMSSHILNEVQRLCSRVAIIKDGRIVATDTVRALIADSCKHIRVVAKQNIPTDFFRLDGVSALEQHGAEIAFLFKGDLKALTSRLAALDLDNLWVGDPDLEEVFLHYYSDGGAQ